MSKCEIWTGNLNNYGRPIVGGGRLAYRLRYQLAHPDEDIAGLDLHHLCGDKTCVEVDHLKVMTRSDHTSMHMRERREAQTHCKNGHEWTDENTAYQTSRGKPCRYCKRCNADKAQRRRLRTKEMSEST